MTERMVLKRYTIPISNLNLGCAMTHSEVAKIIHTEMNKLSAIDPAARFEIVKYSNSNDISSIEFYWRQKENI